MSKIIAEKENELINHSGTARLTIPKEWVDILGLGLGKKLRTAICNGKHGLFLAVWSKTQPRENNFDDVRIGGQNKK